MRSRRRLFWILFPAAAAAAALSLGEYPPLSREAPPPSVILSVPPPSNPNAARLRVLFLGNSLTYAAGLPAMIQGLARTAGVDLVYEQHTPGGARLLNHASDPRVLALLARKGWDAVVLQEQSEWPAFSDSLVRSGVDPYATSLAAKARAGNPSVRLLLYETPARRDGDPQYAAMAPEIATYEGMQARIDRTYERLAALLHGTVVPAGRAWRLATREHPEIDLYDDAVHPGRAGAYLIACVFYVTLVGRTPVGSSYSAGLAPPVAAVLQAIAWRAWEEGQRVR
jgi:hypothetical protein